MVFLLSDGSVLVDFIPILKYYPTWLPGSDWKTQAIAARHVVRAFLETPYSTARSSWLREPLGRPL